MRGALGMPLLRVTLLWLLPLLRVTLLWLLPLLRVTLLWLLWSLAPACLLWLLRMAGRGAPGRVGISRLTRLIHVRAPSDIRRTDSIYTSCLAVRSGFGVLRPGRPRRLLIITPSFMTARRRWLARLIRE